MDIPVEERSSRGRRRLEDRNNGVDVHPRIVVGVDGSHGSRAALAHALVMAARRGAEIEVVSTYPVPLSWAGEYPVDVPAPEVLRADAERHLRDVVAEVRRDTQVATVTGTDDVPVGFFVSAGPAAPTLLDRAEHADVLVVGSRGRGAVKSVLLGSVALQCVAQGRGPVVVVHERPRQPAGPPTVVVGVNGSPHSRWALTTAIEEARRAAAEVEVVAVHEVTNYWVDAYPVAAPSLDDIRASTRRHVDALVGEVLGALAMNSGTPLPTIRTVIAEGSPAEVLVERSRTADLLVVGTATRSALRGLLVGSVALSAALHAACPVMIARGKSRARSTATTCAVEAAIARG